jgi:ADP-ribose pyrophosphatase YjhB (NUDIX family)
VDHLEPAFEAARREANEETGLQIGEVSFLCVTEQIIPDEKQHWVAFIYVTDDASGDAILTEPDKLSEIGWFDLDNPPQPMSVFAAQAFAHLRSA